MSGRREEERNEKIIRGLLKLPPNRRCINCDSLGPQYVCTNFWTFICIICSGIHREFIHRVKSVSMAKFTSQEVEALQRGGNQRAREIFLKDWDVPCQKLPDSGNADRIREFIKSVYVDKKYSGGRSSEKPPRDMQSPKSNEEIRRASSYHSYSQSPPYEHQYEDRRYGKQIDILTRKPGSDREHYAGKLSSFFYSPGRMGEQVHEDRFANEGSGPGFSDYSVSSAGDGHKYDVQSPNFQKDTGFSSPRVQQVRNILIEDGQRQTLGTYFEADTKRNADRIPRPQRTASSGSFGSVDSNSTSLKSVNSASLFDALEREQRPGSDLGVTSVPSSLPQTSDLTHTADQDLFGLPFVKPSTECLAQSIDLFSGFNQPNLSIMSSDEKPVTDSLSENKGWATFDMPDFAVSTSETKNVPSVLRPAGDEIPEASFDAFPSTTNSVHWSSVQNSVCQPSMWIADPWNMASSDSSSVPSSSQSWSAFDDSSGNSTHSFASNDNLQVPAHKPLESVHPNSSLKLSEDFSKIESGGIPVDGGVLDLSLTFNVDISRPSFLSLVPPTMGGYTHEQKSTNPFDLPYDSDLEPRNVLSDMGVLQDALPGPQFPTPLVSNISEPWLTENSVPAYISSTQSGGLTYMPGQPPASHLSNLPSQGPVASMGGNPFA